jgi:hypothetical protein
MMSCDIGEFLVGEARSAIASMGFMGRFGRGRPTGMVWSAAAELRREADQRYQRQREPDHGGERPTALRICPAANGRAGGAAQIECGHEEVVQPSAMLRSEEEDRPLTEHHIGSYSNAEQDAGGREEQEPLR